MIRIAFDTSGPFCSVALGKDKKILGEKECFVPQKHQEKLLPLIDTVLKESGLKITDVDRFIVGVGPGSYTGLRIGVTTARALAQAMKKDIIPVSSIDAIAYNLIDEEKDVLVLIDGKRDQFYLARYNMEKKFTRITDYLVKRPDEVKAIIKEGERGLIIAGDGIRAFKELESKKNIILAEEKDWNPKASSLLLLSEDTEGEKEVHRIKPLYLRLSHAEESRKDKINV